MFASNRIKISGAALEGRNAFHVHSDICSSGQKRTHYRLSMATLLVFVSRFVAKFAQNKWPYWYVRLGERRPECATVLRLRKVSLFKTRSIKQQNRMV
jgi:hypothetical protein